MSEENPLHLVRPAQDSIHCPKCHVDIPLIWNFQPEPEARDAPRQAPVLSPAKQSTSTDVPVSIGMAPDGEHDDRLARLEPMSGIVHPPSSAQPQEPFSLLLGIVQFVLIALILILEIASLAVAVGLKSTGVGIWSAISFFIAAAMKIKLGRSFFSSSHSFSSASRATMCRMVATFIHGTPRRVTSPPTPICLRSQPIPSPQNTKSPKHS